MARTFNRLNAKKVSSIREAGRHADGGNLYLSVASSGAKSWTFFYKFEKRTREMGLGSLNAISLAEARKKAEAARRDLANGIDPLERKKSERMKPASKSFGDLAEEYIDIHKKSWKNPKHADQWRTTLKRDASALWKMGVDQIDVSHVLDVLRPMWARVPETARRLRGRIEKVLASAKVQKLRTGENPARWSENLDHLLPRLVKTDNHFAAMSFDKAPRFAAALRDQEGVGARALEFAMLTATRTIEAAPARWGEIDFDARVWTVPAERMKGSVKHSIPLSSRALAILEGLKGHDPVFIFPGNKPNRPIVTGTLGAVLKRMGIKDATAHGFRSSFKDWAAEKTKFENIVSEMALAHKIASDVEAAYRRGELMEKRRRLMEAWCGYLMRPARGERENIIPFGRKSA